LEDGSVSSPYDEEDQHSHRVRHQGHDEGGCEGSRDAAQNGDRGNRRHSSSLCPSTAPGLHARCLAADQWKKCLSPVKYMVTPAALAAATTSSSRTEPPGCTTAETPASISTCRPSANGKNASDAATLPAARSPAPVTASWQESTRFTCPIPT